MVGIPFHTTTNMMDNKQQTMSGNGSGKENSPRELNA
jgi:hypothetical protein